MSQFTFVTGSLNKRLEAERILGVALRHQPLDLPEIQAVAVEDIVTDKARRAYDRLGNTPVLIEDTGLAFDAWNGLPGGLVKWFMETVGTEGMCRMLDAFPDRRARAKTLVATCDGEVRIFSGEVTGRIAPTPIGDNGFGWDTIFIPDGADRTFAQMSSEEKDRYSMRGMAFRALRDALCP